jgi:hypothetical protein
LITVEPKSNQTTNQRRRFLAIILIIAN